MSPWLSDVYLRSQSDARLLSLARDGQDRAFAVLAERYRNELHAQARRLSATGNADDLVQQTLLSAFMALRRGAEVGHCRGWLHAILRHAAVRAQMPFEAPLDAVAESGITADTLLEARADAREVLLALDELPARQRKALIGSTMQGLSRAELADSLGVSEGAVRQLVHRARIALRAAVTAATPYQLLRWALGSGAGGASEAALGGGAAAGASGILAKIGMVAAAGAIAAGGVAATGHLPGFHGAAAAARTVADADRPALGRAAAAGLGGRLRSGPFPVVDDRGLGGGGRTTGAGGSRVQSGAHPGGGFGAAKGRGTESTSPTERDGSGRAGSGSSGSSGPSEPGSGSRDGGAGGRGGIGNGGPGSGMTTTPAGSDDSGRGSGASGSSGPGSGKQAVPASASDGGGGDVSSTAAPTLGTVSAAPVGSGGGGSSPGGGSSGSGGTGSGSTGSGGTGSGRTGSSSSGSGSSGSGSSGSGS